MTKIKIRRFTAEGRKKWLSLYNEIFISIDSKVLNRRAPKEGIKKGFTNSLKKKVDFLKNDFELTEEVSKAKDLEIKKFKKGSKEFSKLIEIEKSKMSIQRFKGLGEMNPEELWSTTLNPETRNLLQVQYSKNSKKDQELIHTLMGNDVTLRKDFIISNAINVQNLDI